MELAVALFISGWKKGKGMCRVLLAEVPRSSSLIRGVGEGWAHSLLSYTGILRLPADARL